MRGSTALARSNSKHSPSHPLGVGTASAKTKTLPAVNVPAEVRPLVQNLATSSSKLRHKPELGFGSKATGNIVIHGDNLAVLPELVPTLAGRIKCAYLDPPYNNQEEYRHYHDQRSHEAWLTWMRDHLRALKPLLRNDGSVWISIDDRELHYLKVLADEVFGRQNFVTTIVWQQRTTRENRRVFSNDHEYVLVYAIDAKAFGRARNKLAPTAELTARYKNPDNDPRGPWQSVSANVQDGHATPSQFYELRAPSGKRHRPPEGRCWVYTKKRMMAEIASGNVWFGKTGGGVPRLKCFLRDAKPGLTPHTLWLAHEVGTNDDAKKHTKELLRDAPVFDTPKPEPLLRRILEIATDPGDIVLDPFLGSGTTAAVAQKIRRTFIGIESGSHVLSHCRERLKKVVQGEAGGVSKDVAWNGGGGFDFYALR